jgi:hypothetical protein
MAGNNKLFAVLCGIAAVVLAGEGLKGADESGLWHFMNLLLL